MKVSELIEKLKGADPDAIVVLSSDVEGNGYSPLDEVDLGRVYVAETTWSGWIADPEDGYAEGGAAAVLLYPVN